jgi:hypothetical protein
MSETLGHHRWQQWHPVARIVRIIFAAVVGESRTDNQGMEEGLSVWKGASGDEADFFRTYLEININRDARVMPENVAPLKSPDIPVVS